MEIKTEVYKKQGMYLLFTNGDTLDFSKENIKQLADEYWNNPLKLPSQIRENKIFKTCTVCPYRGQDVFCSAMKPLLPFLEKVENFVSYDKVTVIFIKDKDIMYVSDTTMQDALQYVTNMSIFEYCEDVKQYHKYFQGVIPLMDLKEAVSRIFMNIYWLNRGDSEIVNKIIDELNDHITVTSKSCVDRLNLMCKSDVFQNAYVKTHTLAMMLSFDINDTLEQYFKV